MQDVFMYIRDLIQALRPFGDVLEVGFSEASKEIQKYHPPSHTILELHADEAMKWAKKHPGVKVIADVWQGALPALGIFDTIFFGIDPHASPLLQNLTKIRYADADLDSFCHTVSDKKALSRFLAELEQNGQITAQQKKEMSKKYGLSHEPPPKRGRSDELVHFLKACIASHMRKGSRFSCYLSDEQSPANDSLFFNEIVVHPELDYREEGKIIVIEKLV